MPVKRIYVLFFIIFVTVWHTISPYIRKERRCHQWPATTFSTVPSYSILLRIHLPRHLIWPLPQTKTGTYTHTCWPLHAGKVRYCHPICICKGEFMAKASMTMALTVSWFSDSYYMPLRVNCDAGCAFILSLVTCHVKCSDTNCSAMKAISLSIGRRFITRFTQGRPRSAVQKEWKSV